MRIKDAHGAGGAGKGSRVLAPMVCIWKRVLEHFTLDEQVVP